MSQIDRIGVPVPAEFPCRRSSDFRGMPQGWVNVLSQRQSQTDPLGRARDGSAGCSGPCGVDLNPSRRPPRPSKPIYETSSMPSSSRWEMDRRKTSTVEVKPSKCAAEAFATNNGLQTPFTSTWEGLIYTPKGFGDDCTL